MWAIKRTDEYERRHARYEKKRRRELLAVLDNVDTFMAALNAGTKPKQATFGFVHAEPSDVLAIDQKGGGSNLVQTRLYVYPDVARQILYLITLGDKQTQSQDIALCKRFVEKLPELQGDTNGEK